LLADVLSIKITFLQWPYYEGIKIRENAIVGVLSFVNRDIPDDAVAFWHSGEGGQ
jgi:hypothetical protein